MYCIYCGKEIMENTNFCPYCGQKTDMPIEANEPVPEVPNAPVTPATVTETQTPGKKKKIWPRIVFPIISAAIIAVAVLIITSHYNSLTEKYVGYTWQRPEDTRMTHATQAGGTVNMGYEIKETDTVDIKIYKYNDTALDDISSKYHKLNWSSDDFIYYYLEYTNDGYIRYLAIDRNKGELFDISYYKDGSDYKYKKAVESFIKSIREAD